jgi:7-cyano-7-deazaguanine synthase
LNAVVLFSGGLESTTCLAIAIQEGFAVTAVTFDYGQRHRAELAASRRIAEFYGVKHHVFKIDLFQRLGGSALTDPSIDVPKGPAPADTIPVTYVPARNLVFLSYVLGVAEHCGARHVFAGMTAVDYSGYPDCRPEFVVAFQAVANLATKAAVENEHEDGAYYRIRTPLLNLTKADIIRQGAALDVPYRLTHSCYDPAQSGAACGTCDSCLLRAAGFTEAGVPDPTRYR